MSVRQHGCTRSVRRLLLRTLIGRVQAYKRGRGILAGTAGTHSEKQISLSHVYTQRNCLSDRFAREGYDLLGSSDGPALLDFLEEFFCGDDPDNDDGVSSGKGILLLHIRTLLNIFNAMIDEAEDEDMPMAGNTFC